MRCYIRDPDGYLIEGQTTDPDKRVVVPSNIGPL
jgi:hypothetical protein